MTWLTWRQFRAQAAVTYAALGVLGVILVITGVQLADLADTSGSAFLTVFSADRVRTAVFNLSFAAVIILPAIIGVFWGAPLIARELEAGTHRLAWNQSITRTRWLATKIVVIGLAAVVVTAVLSLLVTWWTFPIDDAIARGDADRGLFGVPRMSPPLFGARGIAPIGYAAFAFAFGVSAGAVIRRTVPAMAVTLAVFIAVQIVMPAFIRPHFAPASRTTAITAENLRGIQITAMGPSGPVGPLRGVTVAIDSPGAWIIANETVNAAGRVVHELPAWVAGCVPAGEPREIRRDPACFDRLAQTGYRQRVIYAPADRFWTFQAYETAIFLVLAGILTGFSFWWIRRLA